MVGITIFIITFIIYLATSGGNTPFNHFVLLSNAFLKGQAFVTAYAPWLEQVPINTNHFYVAYPPMPAIVLMPIIKIFGTSFPQQYLAHFFGALFTLMIGKISWKIKEDKKLLIFIVLFSSIGNIIWFLSSVGSSWYLSQVMAAAFLTSAIYEVLTNKRPALIGVLLGAAYLSRLDTILSLPFFILLLSENPSIKNILSINGFKNKSFLKRLFLIGLGVAPFIFFNFYYNFIRFGVIWDKAYLLIPGVASEPWFSKGLFNFSYIPNNLKVMFLSLPKYENKFPFIFPSFGGLSILITSPVFIYTLINNLKDKLVRLSWLGILPIALLVFSHGSSGFAQFGYRFAVDFYPFLMLLTIKSISKSSLKWHHWLLLFVSIFVNTWGVLMINKLRLFTV